MKKEDIKKVLIGAGVAGIGAGLTYLSEWASNTNFGDYTPLVVAAIQGDKDHVSSDPKAE